eukprot:469249-Rhodomonas_salina.1
MPPTVNGIPTARAGAITSLETADTQRELVTGRDEEDEEEEEEGEGEGRGRGSGSGRGSGGGRGRRKGRRTLESVAESSEAAVVARLEAEGQRPAVRLVGHLGLAVVERLCDAALPLVEERKHDEDRADPEEGEEPDRRA